jgi:hypothetical protein
MWSSLLTCRVLQAFQKVLDDVKSDILFFETKRSLALKRAVKNEGKKAMPFWDHQDSASYVTLPF